MNQRGEIIGLSLLLVLGISSLLVLAALELQADFTDLQKRGRLFLCTKETNGETYRFIHSIGQSNWAIKNLNRVSAISLFIPGLQGLSANTSKMKQVIQSYQSMKLVSYLKNLAHLKVKSCPLPTELFKTPFEISLKGFKRDKSGATLLRQNNHSYKISLPPYSLEVEINLNKIEKLNPEFKLISKESTVRQLFPSSPLF